MTDSPPPSRPQQVTTAVVISVTACVLAVVNLFSTRDELRGTTLRDTVAEAQAGVGFGTDEQLVLRVLEVMVLVSGALAATGIVLAVYAWQRHRAAWIGFFVVAALLALTLPVAGVLPILLLACGATFLATRPVRDWFADRVTAPAGSHVALAQEGPSDSAGGPPGQQPPPYPGRFGSGGSSAVPPAQPPQESPPAGGQEPDAPPSYGPWHGGVGLGKPGEGQGGEAPDPSYGGPSYGQSSNPSYGQSYGQPSPYYGQSYGQSDPHGYGPSYGAPGPGRDPDKRPGTVTTACVLTWVGASLVGLLTALASLVLLSDRGSFVREFRRQAEGADLQVTVDQALAVAWTMTGLLLLWCLLAIVLAVLAFRRSRGGRIGLAVSAGLTVLISLLAILSIVAAVPLFMGIAVLVLLFTGGANDWYARRASWSPPGAGPYGGGHPGDPMVPQAGQQPPYGQQQPPYGQQPPPYGQQPPPPPGRSGPW